jgi:hypothetical protein
VPEGNFKSFIGNEFPKPRPALLEHSNSPLRVDISPRSSSKI